MEEEGVVCADVSFGVCFRWCCFCWFVFGGVDEWVRVCVWSASLSLSLSLSLFVALFLSLMSMASQSSTAATVIPTPTPALAAAAPPPPAAPMPSPRVADGQVDHTAPHPLSDPKPALSAKAASYAVDVLPATATAHLADDLPAGSFCRGVPAATMLSLLIATRPDLVLYLYLSTCLTGASKPSVVLLSDLRVAESHKLFQPPLDATEPVNVTLAIRPKDGQLARAFTNKYKEWIAVALKAPDGTIVKFRATEGA